jgi:hypothetical protein
MMSNNETLTPLVLLEKELELRKALLSLKEGLPHLYGFKYYVWQRQFLSSIRHYNTLVANNQSGKSSINIIKAIDWATDKDRWKRLWKKTPTQFWYLYPDYATATSEFETKWMVEFLPKPELKEHPVYGWTKKMRNGDIDYVRFNSGVTIYFKSYAQDVHSLQAGSAYAIFADEEVPWELISELQMRIAATEGYMHFVFTATRGQEEWRRIIEERGKLEMWKQNEVDILKLQVTAYDCLYYEDGTPSTIWSAAKIEETKKLLHTEAQVLRRIYGKFVKDDGLKYPCFVRSQHIIEAADIDLKAGHVYAGVDYGSGTNHQSSICLVWTNKDRTYGCVFDIWAGEKGVATTAGDVVKKYQEMTKDIPVTQVFYDWSAADLKTIAQSVGLFFEKADKSHETGERILNTIFKQNMFKIMENGEWDTLAKQLESLTTDEIKRHAWDDACFVSGTKVLTERGEINIEDLKVNDLVVTRNGPRPISAITTQFSKVSTFTLPSGREVTCTPNHKFYTSNAGFVEIRNITSSDSLLEHEKWQSLKQLSLMESPLEGIQSHPMGPIVSITSPLVATERKECWHSIKRFGSLTMERFLMAITSIIEMGTQPIMQSRILSVQLPLRTSLGTPKNTPQITASSSFRISPISEASLKSGTPQKKEESGTGIMWRNHLVKWKRSTLSAKFVALITKPKSSLLNSAQTSVELLIEGKRVSTTSLWLAQYVANPLRNPVTQKARTAQESVGAKLASCEMGIQKVFNVTVDIDHEYFANGVLVANCDALRYSVTKIPWTYSDLTSKDTPIPIKSSSNYSRSKDAAFKPQEETIEDTITFWDNQINGLEAEDFFDM